MSLPDIRINKINSLGEAKAIIRTLMNLLQEAISRTDRLAKQVQQLEAEVARLSKQSRKPTWTSSGDGKQSGMRGNGNYSSKEYLADSHEWKKSSKKERIQVDREEQLPEIEVCDCGSRQFRVTDRWNKLVQGLIIKRDNVLYRGTTKQCTHCGAVHRSSIPEDIKGQEFSSQLRSWISIFKYRCRMSEGLIHDLACSLGVIISTGQINRIILDNSQKLVPAYTRLVVWGIKLSQYLHTDATSFLRRLANGRVVKEHLHILSHQFLSLFKVTGKYNSFQVKEKVFKKRGLAKKLISDDHSSYGRKLAILVKQLCWIHQLRHYLKLKPRFKTHQQAWCRVVKEWWQWYRMAAEYTRDPTKRVKRLLARGFVEITSQETGYGELDERLAITRRKQTRLLHFLSHPGLPIENNLAERDLRGAVVIRKLSGGTKSIAGTRSFERHLSVIETARKQGLNVFDTLHGLLTNQLDPCVLTVREQPPLPAPPA